MTVAQTDNTIMLTQKERALNLHMAKMNLGIIRRKDYARASISVLTLPSSAEVTS